MNDLRQQPTHDPNHLVKIATEAALQAGRLIHDNIGNDLRISLKDEGVQNLVTEMDTASEKLVKEIISSHIADARFLAEESGGDHDLSRLTWVVDPIDGTVNYAHGVPIYCVSIAAVENDRPLAGVVYNPNLDEMFTATLGGGAFLNGTRLSVGTNADLLKAVLVTGFPYNVAENPYGCIDTFVDFVRLGVPVRRLGSAALDLAYVAAGRFDAFWEVRLNEWDVAAGVLLVTEAGGRISTYAPEPTDGSLVVDRILATNGRIDGAMMEVLRRQW